MNVFGDMAWSDIAASPLAYESTVPEQAAMWLDLHGLSDAQGVKKLLKLVSIIVGTSDDWRINFNSSNGTQCKQYPKFFLPKIEGPISSIVLKNLFIVLFKLKAICKRDEVKKLLKHAEAEVRRLKSWCQHCLKCNNMPEFKRRFGMLDAYEELVERLHDLDDELEEHRNEDEETEDGEC